MQKTTQLQVSRTTGRVLRRPEELAERIAGFAAEASAHA
jgi:hypothetical protein